MALGLGILQLGTLTPFGLEAPPAAAPEIGGRTGRQSRFVAITSPVGRSQHATSLGTGRQQGGVVRGIGGRHVDDE